MFSSPHMSSCSTSRRVLIRGVIKTTLTLVNFDIWLLRAWALHFLVAGHWSQLTTTPQTSNPRWHEKKSACRNLATCSWTLDTPGTSQSWVQGASKIGTPRVSAEPKTRWGYRWDGRIGRECWILVQNPQGSLRQFGRKTTLLSSIKLRFFHLVTWRNSLWSWFIVYWRRKCCNMLKHRTGILFFYTQIDVMPSPHTASNGRHGNPIEVINQSQSHNLAML